MSYARIKTSVLILILSIFYFLKYNFKAIGYINLKLIHSSKYSSPKRLKLIQKSPMAHRKFSQYHAATLKFNSSLIFWFKVQPSWINVQSKYASILTPQPRHKLYLCNLTTLKFSNDFLFIYSVYSALPSYINIPHISYN